MFGTRENKKKEKWMIEKLREKENFDCLVERRKKEGKKSGRKKNKIGLLIFLVSKLERMNKTKTTRI